MKGRILVICDSDQKFITAFAKRAGRQKASGFSVRAFTGRESLLEYAETENADLYLINETILNDELSDICKGKLLILKEQRTPKEDPDSVSEKCCGSVYKYQSVSELMRRVLEFFSTVGKNGSYNNDRKPGENADHIREAQASENCFSYKPDTEMIGVFSPIAGCGKSSFALSLARHLQTEKPTLFMSFECLSGWRQILHMEGRQGGGLADAVYYLRNGHPKVADRILSSVQKIGELSFLPPFDDPADLIHVTEEEWKVILESIRDQTGFEAVVADLGMIPAVYPAVLLNFPKIFMAVGDGVSEMAKLDDFERYLQKNGMDQEIKERVITIKIGENADEAYERTVKSDFPEPVSQSDADFIRQRQSFG